MEDALSSPTTVPLPPLSFDFLAVLFGARDQGGDSRFDVFGGDFNVGDIAFNLNNFFAVALFHFFKI